MSETGHSVTGSGRAPEEVRAINEASVWFVRLNADERDIATLRREWQAWLALDPAHPRAWQKVEAVCRHFDRVPGRIAVPTLHSLASRRTVLRSMVLLGASGVVALGATRLGSTGDGELSYRTARGERRRITLADGSALDLNGGSHLEVLFDGESRRLRLHEGEIIVATHADPQHRPFSVDTPQGRILALGTRFTVRREGERSVVSVLEKVVELTPVDAPQRKQRLRAGEQAFLSRHEATPPMPAEALLSSWESGYLVVVDMPLGRFVDELGRYHPGHLGCDTGIAGLKVSGAFPIDDLEGALGALGEVFPLRLQRFTRYWTRLVPR